MERSTLFAVVLAGLALGGCPLKTECNTGRVMDDAGACICPAGTVAAADGTCVYGDGGMVDLGVDLGPDFDAGPCGHACTGATPVCLADAGACVGCGASTDCTTSTSGHVCDLTTHTCVPCTADADCTSPDAAQCDTGSHTCVPCTGDGPCAHFPSARVCNTSASTATCVECTAGNRMACGTRVCDHATHTCATGHIEHTQGICQPCVADDECLAGDLCIDEIFPSTGGTSVGAFCFQTEASAVSCSMTPPYSRSHSVTSVDDRTAAICDLGQTTCPARADYGNTDCAPTGTADSMLCGAMDVADGVCALYNPGEYRCSTPCNSNPDCDPGITCNTGVFPHYCNF